MKNFLKDNWFEIIIAIAILIVAASVGYYFLFYLPRKNNDDRMFTKETDCQKYAQAIIKGINDANTVNTTNGLNVVDTSFDLIFYSPKQNTCLYTTFVTSSEGVNAGKSSYLIYDALTNNLITSFDYPNKYNDYKKFIFEYSNGEVRL